MIKEQENEILLKRCPFCSGNKIKISCDDFGLGQFKIRKQAWWIQCQSNHCYALQQGSTKEKAINRWNTRNEVDVHNIG